MVFLPTCLSFSRQHVSSSDSNQPQGRLLQATWRRTEPCSPPWPPSPWNRPRREVSVHISSPPAWRGTVTAAPSVTSVHPVTLGAFCLPDCSTVACYTTVEVSLQGGNCQVLPNQHLPCAWCVQALSLENERRKERRKERVNGAACNL